MKKNFLREYINHAPLALAFERTLECHIYDGIQLIPPILDLGCGDGLFMNVLGKIVQIGIDPNRKELLRAKKNGGYKKLIQSYGDAMPLPSQSYNTIISNSVLEHIRSLEPVICEVNRILRFNGHFYFTVPSDKFDKYSFFNRCLNIFGLNNFIKMYSNIYNSFWKHFHFGSISYWKSLVSKYGFTVENSFSYNPGFLCTINDLLVPFSLACYLNKKITNRWVISTSFRRLISLPIYLCAKEIINGPMKSKNGGLIFISAKKVKDYDDLGDSTNL